MDIHNFYLILDKSIRLSSEKVSEVSFLPVELTMRPDFGEFYEFIVPIRELSKDSSIVTCDIDRAISLVFSCESMIIEKLVEWIYDKYPYSLACFLLNRTREFTKSFLKRFSLSYFHVQDFNVARNSSPDIHSEAVFSGSSIRSRKDFLRGVTEKAEKLILFPYCFTNASGASSRVTVAIKKYIIVSNYTKKYQKSKNTLSLP